MQTNMMGNRNCRTIWAPCFCFFSSLSFFFFFCCFCLAATESLSSSSSASASASPPPEPTPWPLQFHSLLYLNYSGALEIADLWYDWPNGRNLHIIQKQLGRVLHDVEWNNKTSFFYYLDDQKECRTVHLEVGILRPNWLNGSNYLGIQTIDGGFTCHVWEKVDFIWYYEDVKTHRPVHWRFYTGRSVHVMTFDVGMVLEDEKWQAPYYCFQKDDAPLLDSVEEDVDDEFSLSKINFNNRIGLE